MSDSMAWRQIEFEGQLGGPRLRGRLSRHEALDQHAPVVMMLTGDGPKGSQSLSWANLPPLLAAAGMRSFVFDFTGLGYSEGDRRILTPQTGQQDLVSAFAQMTELCGARAPLGAIASSFGANALLCRPEIANQLRCIVLKSPAPFLPDAYLNEIGDDAFEVWKRDGFSDENGYFFSVFLAALETNGYITAQKITTPCLITHGTADEIVPFRQSVILSACLAGETTLVPFEAVGHGYSEAGAWDRMAALYVDWLRDKLRV